MKIAIVTPYCRESGNVLRRCRDSVAAQSVQADHYFVADGYPQRWLDSKCHHITLPAASGDFGNTPRSVGALVAVSHGAEAVAFLDADNTFDADHLEVCLDAARKQRDADLVVARRRFVRPDGSTLPVGDEPGHVDTNCYLLLGGALHTVAQWALQPRMLSRIGDRVFWRMLNAQGLKPVVTARPTVNYYTMFRVHYEALGEVPPDGAKETIEGSDVKLWWERLSPRENEIACRRIGMRLEF